VALVWARASWRVLAPEGLILTSMVVHGLLELNDCG
jgi:hypothetical protein